MAYSDTLKNMYIYINIYILLSHFINYEKI